MILDSMLLIYAFRADAANHAAYLSWLDGVLRNGTRFGIPDVVFSAFIRITTNPKAQVHPSSMEGAIAFANVLRSRAGFFNAVPPRSHWNTFTGLCQQPGIVGNDVTDAYIAALAIEYGLPLMTTDKGFRRFPGLSFRHPLEP